jgi:hypothetical protein
MWGLRSFRPRSRPFGDAASPTAGNRACRAHHSLGLPDFRAPGTVFAWSGRYKIRPEGARSGRHDDVPIFSRPSASAGCPRGLGHPQDQRGNSVPVRPLRRGATSVEDARSPSSAARWRAAAHLSRDLPSRSVSSRGERPERGKRRCSPCSGCATRASSCSRTAARTACAIPTSCGPHAPRSSISSLRPICAGFTIAASASKRSASPINESSLRRFCSADPTRLGSPQELENLCIEGLRAGILADRGRGSSSGRPLYMCARRSRGASSMCAVGLGSILSTTAR